MKRSRIFWLIAVPGFLACLALLLPISPLYMPQLIASYMLTEDGRSLSSWIKALKDDDPDVRVEACQALSRRGAEGAEAVPALAAVMLEDSSSEVRGEASRALTMMVPASRAVVPALAQALQDSDPWVRMYAVLTLLRLRSEARPAVPALLIALKDKRNDTNLRVFRITIREVVALTLGWASAGTDEAVPALMAALTSNTSRGMRVALIRALGDIGAPARPATRQLRTFLEDTDSYVREAAEQSLQQIGASGPAGK
jgi:hypothetical protein